MQSTLLLLPLVELHIHSPNFSALATVVAAVAAAVVAAVVAAVTVVAFDNVLVVVVGFPASLKSKIAAMISFTIGKPVIFFFLKVTRSGGEPGIFLIFVYFLSQAVP